MILSALGKIQEIQINTSAMAEVQMTGNVGEEDSKYWIHWFCFQSFPYLFRQAVAMCKGQGRCSSQSDITYIRIIRLATTNGPASYYFLLPP